MPTLIKDKNGNVVIFDYSDLPLAQMMPRIEALKLEDGWKHDVVPQTHPKVHDGKHPDSPLESIAKLKAEKEALYEILDEELKKGKGGMAGLVAQKIKEKRT